MKSSELLAALERHIETYGDTYVAIRHQTEHEFRPDDDLMDISTTYNRNNNLFTLLVRN